MFVCEFVWFTGCVKPFKSSDISAAELCRVCSSVCACAEEMEGERKAAAAVASKKKNSNSLLVMLQSRLHLSQLKSVFPHKQQSTTHKNSFCFSINNPLVLSPLHMCMGVYVCVCVYSCICLHGINNPLYSRQEHRVIHQFLHRKPISLEMFSFSPTHHLSSQRDKKRGGGWEKDTHIHRVEADKEEKEWRGNEKGKRGRNWAKL